MRNLFSTGRFNQVPIINGTNRDEYTWFQAMAEIATGHVITAAEYPARLTATFGAAVSPTIQGLYPLDKFPSPSNALAAAVGDNAFVCNGARRSNRVVKRFVKDVFEYEFDVPSSPVPWPPVSFPYQSPHTVEIQYLFPLFHGGSGDIHQLNKSQQRLAAQMVQYWTTFAHTGSPNGERGRHGKTDLPYWPRYDERVDSVLSLRLPEPVVVTGFGDRHNCDFWDSLFQ
jgi:para-nitrobenzyl esterase